MKNKNFFKSFFHALDGVKDAFLSERNLRFHFVIANLIFVFAYYYELSRVSWTVLALTVFAVISAELMNTAVENAVDTATHELKESARLAKDASAGAVLVMSLGAIIVGIYLFGDAEKITYTLTVIFTSVKNLILCTLLGIFDLYILFGIKK